MNPSLNGAIYYAASTLQYFTAHRRRSKESFANAIFMMRKGDTYHVYRIRIVWAMRSSRTDIIAVFDEDGTRDAAVTNLDLPRPTFRARDLHNQST